MLRISPVFKLDWALVVNPSVDTLPFSKPCVAPGLTGVVPFSF